MNDATEFPERYYRPSGAVPVLGTLTMLFGGMAAAVVFGLIAAAVNRWLPYIIILLAVTLGYGALVGWAVRFSAKIAHVRHPGFTLFVAFAIGLFAVYISWVCFLWVWTLRKFDPIVNAFEFVAIFGDPAWIIGGINAIAVNGGRTIFGWTPKGGMLYAIWIIEALMYVFFVMAIAHNTRETYCEDCRCWTKRNEKLDHMPLTDVAALKTELEAERYEVLDELRSQACDPNDRLDIGSATCPHCTATTFLTVSRTKAGTDGNGNVTENSEPVIQHLIVPRELADRMAVAAPKRVVAIPEAMPATENQ